MSFYKKQLEQAREALLSRGGIFSVPTAKEQAKVQEEGLMRPRLVRSPGCLRVPQVDWGWL